MSSHETGLFESEYWNHHRNALFFALLALVLSAPGVDYADFGISGLKLGKMGGAILMISAIGAATYSLAAFILEWRQEALPYLRKKANENDSARELIIKSAKSFDALTQHQKWGLEFIADARNHLGGLGASAMVARLWSIVNEYQMRVNNEPEASLIFSNFIGSCANEFLEGEPAFQFWSEKINLWERQIESINQERQDLTDLAKRLKCKLRKVGAVDWLRIVGIGLLSPLILYIAALTMTTMNLLQIPAAIFKSTSSVSAECDADEKGDERWLMIMHREATGKTIKKLEKVC